MKLNRSHNVQCIVHSNAASKEQLFQGILSLHHLRATFAIK